MNEILKEIVNDLVIRELAERSADSLSFIALLVLPCTVLYATSMRRLDARAT